MLTSMTRLVVMARPEPRQHRHLRAALDLENADRIRAADPVVGPRIVRRDPVERQAPAIMLLDQPKTEIELREGAEPQQVHLEQAEILQVVLVPLDDRPAGPRRVLDRHQVVDRLVAEQEPARMDREVPRHAPDLLAQPEEVAVQRSGRVEPGVRQPRRIERTATRQQPGGAADRGSGDPERPADLPHGRPAAIADDVRHHGGVVAAVLPVDVPDHLLAPRMHDVEVDVGRLAPLARQEPLEQQIDPRRIDCRDPEAVADHRVRRRAAALAENPLLPAVADDLPHGQEIAPVVRARRSAPAPCRSAPGRPAARRRRRRSARARRAG